MEDRSAQIEVTGLIVRSVDLFTEESINLLIDEFEKLVNDLKVQISTKKENSELDSEIIEVLGKIDRLIELFRQKISDKKLSKGGLITIRSYSFLLKYSLVVLKNRHLYPNEDLLRKELEKFKTKTGEAYNKTSALS